MKVIPVPDILAKPIFHLIYLINRRIEGAKVVPIRRKVMPVDNVRRQAFDQLLEKALAGDPRVPIEYDLPFPKHEFLNYVCDWRGYVVHGSPLHDLEVLQPIRKSGDNNEFGNRQQIFASPDAIWAMWFAILHKGKFNLTRNGSVRVGVETAASNIIILNYQRVTGKIILLPKACFTLPVRRIFLIKDRFRFWTGLMQRSKNGEARNLFLHSLGYASPHKIFYT